MPTTSSVRTRRTAPHPQHPARRRPGSRASRQSFRVAVAALLLLTLGLVAVRGDLGGLAAGRAPAEREEPAHPGPVDRPRGPIKVGFSGLTTFRGNPARSYYGEGPVPDRPSVLWRYPSTGGLCSMSRNFGETKRWCGTGWTGQPNVVEHEDGRLEVRFGAYDGRYHFLDGRTGERMRPSLQTGDLAKGSATTDPDGFPLFYAGSRDNYLRVIALDRAKPKVLWKLDADANPNGLWNDDWDGAPLVIGDYLLEGGENSWFYVVKLNRGRDARGRMRVDPRIVMMVPGYDDELLAATGDEDVSIESSVAFRDGVAYFVNSGGLVQGWDIRHVLEGGREYRRVFRFWTGDDTDATVVIDDEGYLYVARHGERATARDREIGDLMKLDPRKPDDPLVWSVHVTGGSAEGGGIWATPALSGDTVWVGTNYGELLGVHAGTGEVLSTVRLPGPLWGSPVVVDDRLLIGDCAGMLRSFDVSRPRKPRELWRVQLDGCVESTPAVWKGRVWVGTRGGGMYAIGDAEDG